MPFIYKLPKVVLALSAVFCSFKPYSIEELNLLIFSEVGLLRYLDVRHSSEMFLLGNPIPKWGYVDFLRGLGYCENRYFVFFEI